MELGNDFFPPRFIAARHYDSLKSLSTIYNVSAKCGQTTPTSWTSSPWRSRIHDSSVRTHIFLSKQEGQSQQPVLAEKRCAFQSSYQKLRNLLIKGAFLWVTKGNITRKTKQCRQRLWANCFQTPGDIRRRSDSCLASTATVDTCRAVARGDPSQQRHSNLTILMAIVN